MIKFKKLTMRNFMAVGNDGVEIDLDPGGVTLITGPNGSGKSSVVAALYFVLFGKSFKRVNLEDMINNVNRKNLSVSLEFEAGNCLYKVTRGLKPKIFEIERDSKPVSFVSVKDYQKYLNENVLNMDAKTFEQLCVICSTNYVPFLKLTAAERRTVIDDIFGMNVFADMLESVKEASADNKSLICELEKELVEIRHSFELASQKQKNLSGMFRQYIAEDRSKIDALKKELPESLAVLDSYSEQMESFDLSENAAEMKRTSSVLASLKSEISFLEARKKEDSSQAAFFKKNKTCPVCTQEIREETAKKVLGYIEDKGREADEKISALSAKITECVSSLEECASKTDGHSKLKTARDLLRKKLVGMKQEIVILEDKIRKYEEDMAESKAGQKEALAEIKRKITAKCDDVEKARRESEELETLTWLLKDDGVKKTVLKNYIPVVNTIVKKYLALLELEYSFEFDENFAPVITMHGLEPRDYNSLSEGEAARLNFILLFVFRDFAKVRKSLDTNLLFVDEFGDSTLDAGGIQCLNSVFSLQAKESIFVISHYPDNYRELASKSLNFSKTGRFSNMESSCQ